MWHVVQEQELFNTGIIFPGRAGVLPLGQVQRWHVEGGIETKETAAQFLVMSLFDFHQVHEDDTCNPKKHTISG